MKWRILDDNGGDKQTSGSVQVLTVLVTIVLTFSWSCSAASSQNAGGTSTEESNNAGRWKMPFAMTRSTPLPPGKIDAMIASNRGSLVVSVNNRLLRYEGRDENATVLVEAPRGNALVLAWKGEELIWYDRFGNVRSLHRQKMRELGRWSVSALACAESCCCFIVHRMRGARYWARFDTQTGRIQEQHRILEKRPVHRLHIARREYLLPSDVPASLDIDEEGRKNLPREARYGSDSGLVLSSRDAFPLHYFLIAGNEQEIFVLDVTAKNQRRYENRDYGNSSTVFTHNGGGDGGGGGDEYEFAANKNKEEEEEEEGGDQDQIREEFATLLGLSIAKAKEHIRDFTFAPHLIFTDGDALVMSVPQQKNEAYRYTIKADVSLEKLARFRNGTIAVSESSFRSIWFVTLPSLGSPKEREIENEAEEEEEEEVGTDSSSSSFAYFSSASASASYYASEIVTINAKGKQYGSEEAHSLYQSYPRILPAVAQPRQLCVVPQDVFVGAFTAAASSSSSSSGSKFNLSSIYIADTSSLRRFTWGDVFGTQSGNSIGESERSIIVTRGEAGKDLNFDVISIAATKELLYVASPHCVQIRDRSSLWLRRSVDCTAEVRQRRITLCSNGELLVLSWESSIDSKQLQPLRVKISLHSNMSMLSLHGTEKAQRKEISVSFQRELAPGESIRALSCDTKAFYATNTAVYLLFENITQTLYTSWRSGESGLESLLLNLTAPHHPLITGLSAISSMTLTPTLLLVSDEDGIVSISRSTRAITPIPYANQASAMAWDSGTLYYVGASDHTLYMMNNPPAPSPSPSKASRFSS